MAGRWPGSLERPLSKIPSSPAGRESRRAETLGGEAGRGRRARPRRWTWGRRSARSTLRPGSPRIRTGPRRRLPNCLEPPRGRHRRAFQPRFRRGSDSGRLRRGPGRNRRGNPFHPGRSARSKASRPGGPRRLDGPGRGLRLQVRGFRRVRRESGLLRESGRQGCLPQRAAWSARGPVPGHRPRRAPGLLRTRPLRAAPGCLARTVPGSPGLPPVRQPAISSPADRPSRH